MADAICRHVVTVFRDGHERCAVCEMVDPPRSPAPPAETPPPSMVTHHDWRSVAVKEKARAEAAEARAAGLEEALRGMLAEEDKVRECSKHMTTWMTIRDWYRAHPGDSEVVAAARALLAAHGGKGTR